MANLPRHPVLAGNQYLTDIIKDYFRKGHTYLEILEFLKVPSLFVQRVGESPWTKTFDISRITHETLAVSIKFP